MQSSNTERSTAEDELSNVAERSEYQRSPKQQGILCVTLPDVKEKVQMHVHYEHQAIELECKIYQIQDDNFKTNHRVSQTRTMRY